MEQDITIYIRRSETEEFKQHVVPADMGLSLMEFMKAAEIPVMATCGGMALCATCHVVVENKSNINEPTDDEYAMLDTLPEIYPGSRLGCQIRLNDSADGLRVTFKGELEGQ